MSRLNRGEAEAITLALEIRPEVILIDEARGQAIAEEMGLLPMGALGLLVRAKRAGLVKQVAPLIDRLVHEVKFRVSDEVRAAILKLADE